MESGETKEDFGEDGRSAVDAMAEQGGEGSAQLRVRHAARRMRDDEHWREGADGLSHDGRRRGRLRIHLLRL